MDGFESKCKILEKLTFYHFHNYFLLGFCGLLWVINLLPTMLSLRKVYFSNNRTDLDMPATQLIMYKKRVADMKNEDCK